MLLRKAAAAQGLLRASSRAAATTIATMTTTTTRASAALWTAGIPTVPTQKAIRHKLLQCTPDTTARRTASTQAARPAKAEVHRGLAYAEVLDQLRSYVDAGDVVGAYRVASGMRAEGLLRYKERRTVHVLLDTAVAKQLIRAIGTHGVWAEVLPLVNLLVEVQTDQLGHKYTDRRFPRTSAAVHRGVQSDLVVELLKAVLSEQFAALPERWQAGTTAQQILADYYTQLRGHADTRMLRIRATGFASSGRRLNALLKRPEMQALDEREHLEALRAHARCLNMGDAAGLTSLARDTESLSAWALCLAEHGRLDEALEQSKSLDGVPGLRLRLWIVRASALAVVPRQPYTEAFHTLASRYLSKPFKSGLAALLDGLLLEMRKIALTEDELQRSGINRLVFDCLCAAASMSTELSGALLAPDELEWKLQRLLESSAKRLAAAGALADDAASATMAYALMARPLVQFLWATLLSDRRPELRKRLMISAIDDAKRLVPVFVPAAHDLEPLLLASMPAALWLQSRRGNFREASAFAPPDSFLHSPERVPADTLDQRILDMVSEAARVPGADRRVYPLAVMLLGRVYGEPMLALQWAQEAIEGGRGLAVVPGTLALAAPTHDALFLERMLTALSTFKQGADWAIAHMTPLVHRSTQTTTRTLPPRVAGALLMCCAATRNALAARDTITEVQQSLSDGREPSPWLRELFMRACFRGGSTKQGVDEFQQLSYQNARTLPGEPSFAMILAHMGDSQVSVVGAEHVFDAWFELMGFRGWISPALHAQYTLLRGSSTPQSYHASGNAFLPMADDNVAAAMQRLGVEERGPGEHSSRHFIRVWELHMVVGLVSAYVRNGQTKLAAGWEDWLLTALYEGRVEATPEVTARLAYVQKRHLRRQTLDGFSACLDYVVAIDRATRYALFDSEALLNGQLAIVRQLKRLFVENREFAVYALKYLSAPRKTWQPSQYLYDRIMQQDI
ncbi:hypothetical protein GGI07_003029 [Coemansia sp. Benny D115]|nr:hypothetical protein GGI07_003029 [Coemansia sp. Benny D115]